ncbi:MAG TPA: HAD family hydrolase [Cyclobacteriaceae bacterium]|nr:HAD family hydrolase [Cyclobacteriaceae bacterium]
MKKSGYYIQLFSPHGLIRHVEPEIGRDKDTGGQVKYVLELLESLSKHPRIEKVDLITRKIIDKRVSRSYENEVEEVNEKARIIRLTCGGTIYRPKESLWNYLDEFIDNAISFIQKQDRRPDVFHGHYGDGNYIAGQLSSIYGKPFISTGHSLGRNKKNILMQQGLSAEKINEKFNMDRRISVEEETIHSADIIIVSTQHEIISQYKLYENAAAGRFKVIPPGVNTDLFYPFYRLEMPSFKMSIEQEQALYRINSEIERFLFNPAKPLIVSIGRADKRKNFETIIEAFGRDRELQTMANLAIFAGVRKDISDMPLDEQELLTNLLLMLDKYDLYGKMAIPKRNDPKMEVPEIYRIAARKKGVFVNATPGENFGLTVIEAAACGLPVIASPDGGPREIVMNCENGLLVNVEDSRAVADALKKIIVYQAEWETYSANGIRASNQLYSWEAHASSYVDALEELLNGKDSAVPFRNKPAFGSRLEEAERFIIVDLDGTLIEGKNTDGVSELKQFIAEHEGRIVFGVASGRNREITAEAFARFNLPPADILICSAGSEIYYTSEFVSDKGWQSHINFQWEKDAIESALSKSPLLRLQEPQAQWPFKLSYYVESSFDRDDLAEVYRILDEKKLRGKILLTENRFLDILPLRASKGGAIRYLSSKWQMPLKHIITAGNSGNDIDMLQGKTRGIVVANYSSELEELRKNKSVFFANKPLARGVMEGVRHFMETDPI